jgi:hypothetical protein
VKTFGRILILSSVFVLLAGLIIVAVNVSGLNAPDFGHDRPTQTEFRPLQGDEEGGQLFGPEGERGGFGGFRWIFGMVKNIGVIAILVTAIVWPKSILRKRIRLQN